MNRKIDMERLTQLAGLRLSQEERARLQTDLEEMVSCIESLTHIPEAELAETALSAYAPSDAREWLRADETEASLPLEELLQNAPLSDGAYFVVPQTVGEEKE